MSFFQMSQWSGTNSVNFFTGFLMDNNCNLIAESGQTTDSQEVSYLLLS